MITYFDTYEGKTIKIAEDIVEEETLRVSIPELAKDIAVKVEKYKK